MTLYPTHSTSVIAQQLGRSFTAVRSKVQNLGLIVRTPGRAPDAWLAPGLRSYGLSPLFSTHATVLCYLLNIRVSSRCG
jgi:hypothetical protein